MPLKIPIPKYTQDYLRLQKYDDFQMKELKTIFKNLVRHQDATCCREVKLNDDEIMCRAKEYYERMRLTVGFDAHEINPRTICRICMISDTKVCRPCTIYAKRKTKSKTIVGHDHINNCVLDFMTEDDLDKLMNRNYKP